MCCQHYLNWYSQNFGGQCPPYKYTLTSTQNFVMRYSIMLQLVTSITIIFLGTAALFGWLQYRPAPTEENTQSSILLKRLSANLITN
jgi:hypothetical protein